MGLSPGTRLGSYEVIALLGAGGMGEVYRARDIRLQRDVAIKALPDTMAGDAERIARFEREAQVLASLSHPNIAAIYGLEQFGDSRYLVLEFVDGQSLADRLTETQGPSAPAAARGGGAPRALSTDEAMAIAKQILDALEAAHEKGIVHRDIKPANIMLTADGSVKVLDFGLARVIEPDGAADISNSPTLTARATQAGMILGTAAYMSPEQAKGRTADKRSDVWAFGCVLYEMLSGKRAFAGEDVSETLAAVLRDTPNLSDLPATVPPAVKTLIQRCLERDRKTRIPEIAAVRFLLQEAIAAPVVQAAARFPPARLRPWPARAAIWALAAIVMAGLGGALAWRLKPAPSPAVTRFAFTLPSGQIFSGAGRHLVALSPDGSHVLFVADSRLNLRATNNLLPRSIPGTEVFGNVTDPVFSPDGRFVAFWAGNESALKKISVDGGTAATICPAGNPFGMDWYAGGLLFSDGATGIMRVSSDGGTPEVLVRVKPGEVAQSPQMLPGGDAVVFSIASGTARDRWDRGTVVVQSLKSGERKVLVTGGTDARYASSGHVVYSSRGVLFAVPFDPKRLEVSGQPAAVLEGVRRAAAFTTGAVHFGISRSGVLAYIPGPVSNVAGAGDVAVADKTGELTPLNLPQNSYEGPRVSPDGSRLVVGTDDGKEQAVWVYDLAGNTAIRRLTFGGSNRFPIWTWDGKRVVFQSDREGDGGIFWQPADGMGAAERLTKAATGERHVPESWSPKGGHLLYTVGTSAGQSLWLLSLQDRKSAPFGDVRSTTHIGAVFSPDGQWVAYSETNGPQTGIYVQPFPPTGAKYQLPPKPGDTPTSPIWTPDGHQLIYWPRASGFEAVTVTTRPTFGFGNPVPVPRQFASAGPSQRRDYDISPGGKIFASAGSGVNVRTGEIVVVLNWNEELTKRAPR